MFDESKNRFPIKQIDCNSVADMLLFNIYEQLCAMMPLSVSKLTQDKPKRIEASINPTVKTAPVSANKQAKKAGEKKNA